MASRRSGTQAGRGEWCPAKLDPDDICLLRVLVWLLGGDR